MASANTATMEVKLDTAQLKGSAADAAKALGDLKDQISSDTKALKEMQSAMANLQKGNVVNVDQFRQLKTAIDAKKQAIAAAQSSVISLGGNFSKTGAKATSLRTRLQLVGADAKQIGGPIGLLAGRLEIFSKAAGSSAGKFALMGGAMLALGAAAVLAARGLYGLAVASAEARREEQLQLEGTLSLAKGIGDTEAASKDLQATIDKVSAGSAASKSAISGLGATLYAAGLRGGDLEQALDAAGMKAAVQGPAAAAAFVKVAAATEKAGGSVQELAGKIQRDLGGIAAKKLLSTEIQAQKFREAVGGMFAGVDIDPLLKARKAWTDMFSETTAAGKAFRAVVEPLGQILIDGVTEWTTVLQAAVIKALLWAIKLEIQWLKLKRAFFEVVPKDIFEGFRGKEALIAGVTAAVAALTVGAIALTVALAPLIASAAVLAAPWVLAAASIWSVINTIRLLYEVWQEIDWSGIWKIFADGWAKLGPMIFDGLIEGIKSKFTAFADVMKAFGQWGMKAFKFVLGISSPSKEFAKLGLAIPQGVQEGLAAGKPALDRAMDQLVEPPNLSVPAPHMSVAAPELPAQGSAGGAAAAGSTGAATNNTFTFNIEGSSSPQSTADAIERRIRQIFSITSVQMGVAT